MPRVLLVGGGVTSAVIGTLLRRDLPNATIVLWDKARGAGGRMSTSRSPNDPSCTVDLGAQYISTTPEYAELHASYYDMLLGSGILAPLTGRVVGMRGSEDTKHYVTPSGCSSIVKFFMKEANITPKYEHHVKSVDSAEGGKWKVESQDGVLETFDAVVLTMPVPQIMALAGTVNTIIDGDAKLRSNLQSVAYSSRYALGLFYDGGSSEGVALPDDVAAQYISNDPVIRFVALDHRKRGAESAAPSVVVHTSVPFGKVHVDKTPDQVKPMLLSSVTEMFPHWPQPSAVKCQKWRFSQVTSAFPGLPGVVKFGDGLLGGGDGFTHSNLDGCIESARAVAAELVQYVNSKSS